MTLGYRTSRRALPCSMPALKMASDCSDSLPTLHSDCLYCLLPFSRHRQLHKPGYWQSCPEYCHLNISQENVTETGQLLQLVWKCLCSSFWCMTCYLEELTGQTIRMYTYKSNLPQNRHLLASWFTLTGNLKILCQNYICNAHYQCLSREENPSIGEVQF